MSGKDEAIAHVYRGGERFVYGVPARSLTHAEYDELSPHLKREVLKGGLYYPYVRPEPVKDEPKRSSKATGDGADKAGE